MVQPRPQTPTHAHLREHNLIQVLQRLKTTSPLSRAQLAELTRLNKSTISSLIDELMSLGLIYETGLLASNGGRPGRLLELNPQAGAVVSCEFGVDFIMSIVTNFWGQIVWRQRVETEPHQGQTQILSELLENINRAIITAHQYNPRLLGIGLSSTGMVDIDQGMMIFSPNLRWRNVPLKQIVAEATQLPIFVENDANAAALGEHFFGSAQNVNDFLFILADVGIGGGLFLNGDLYRGTSGLAGEIGHLNFNLSSRPCRCGKRGCWEMEANKASLINRVQTLIEIGHSSRLTSSATFSQIVQAAKEGDAVALEALSETGSLLGLGIANLVDIFNPELVVFGGTMSEAGEFLLPAIRQTLQTAALDTTRRQAVVALSAFGTDAIVIGAATLVIQAILANPKSIESLA
jgi:glucokinase-like ROK family protein